MALNAHRIRAFAVAAREGGFSLAAARLGVSPSAVSQQIMALEREIGAALFLRRRAGLELTRTGADLFALADRWDKLGSALEERLTDVSSLATGHLRVVANSPRPALEHIAAFGRAAPGIEISFTLLDWTSAMRSLRERAADVGIITEPSALPNWNRRELGRARYCAYLRRDHALAARDLLRMADILPETVLLPEEGSFTRRYVGRVLKARGLTLDRSLSTTTFPLMREAVLHGVGIGLFLEDALHPEDTLVSRPVEELSETHATCLMTPSDGVELASLRLFEHCVQDRR
ncbi:MAG: LysR substrate-binding domain-containing protein [Pseudomonadota bacterium]